LGATHLLSLQTQITPVAPVVENAGSATAFLNGDGGGLRWKLSSSLTWRRANWTLGWTTRFFDSYFLNTDHGVVPDQGSATIPSQTYHDVFGRYQFTSDSKLAGAEVAFGINNVFNKEPPVDVTAPQGLGYSLWGDPRLASYYLSIKKSF
jgi:outer membrane receptor protein involved in Fe transport